jgi:hypothetical protein
VWNSVVARLMNVNIKGEGTFFCCFETNERDLGNKRMKVSMALWHLNLPLKIKIFMWFLKRGVILKR